MIRKTRMKFFILKQFRLITKDKVTDNEYENKVYNTSVRI